MGYRPPRMPFVLGGWPIEAATADDADCWRGLNAAGSRGLVGRRFGVTPRPARPYLSRMSFLTDFTPLTPRVTSSALLISAWVLTKPLNWTMPL